MKFEGFDKVGDAILCNIYFFLCSIPIFTAGAAATAMHYALRRCMADEGSVTRDYFTAFRREFRQATVIWVIYLALFAALVGNFWLVSNWEGTLATVVRTALIVVSVVSVLSVSLVFPMLARFSNSTRGTMKNSMLLSLASPVRSVVAAALNLLPFALAVLLPNFFALVAVGWVLALSAASAYAIQRLYASLFARIEENVLAAQEAQTNLVDDSVETD